jgi:hypothetical protein
VVFPLLLLLLLSPLLWNQGLIYQIATVAQLVFYGCALLGLLLSNTRLGRLKPFTIPYFFCMVNAACMIATVNLIRGHRIDFWEPQRQTESAAASVEQAAQPSTVKDHGHVVSN